MRTVSVLETLGGPGEQAKSFDREALLTFEEGSLCCNTSAQAGRRARHGA